MFAHAQGRFAITVHSPHLDLSWSQDPALLPGCRHLGKVKAHDPPSVMPQDPFKRRISRNVAGQPDGFGIEIRRNGDLSPLSIFHDRLEINVLQQCCLAALMNAPDRCANLIVAIGTEVLLKKINQPAFPLEDSKHLYGRLRGCRE